MYIHLDDVYLASRVCDIVIVLKVTQPPEGCSPENFPSYIYVHSIHTHESYLWYTIYCILVNR